MTRSGEKGRRSGRGGRDATIVNFTDLKPLAVLPVCCAVRRTSLAAGMVAALFTGGLPLVGFETGLVMGRASLLPPILAFLVHLAVSLFYGVFFCLAISRSRNGWTLLAAAAVTLALYAANFTASEAWHLGRLWPETHALLAHFIFGAAFTFFFKLAEIGVPEPEPPRLWQR